ncbi:M28 family peptidase [Terrilactibacillus sp. S3-3]|nr:M28 family peptidase [Terrilactibacillus sp. S3-3]
MALDETGITHLKINKSRIKQRLKALSQFGLNQNGGIDRSFAGKADAEARKWFLSLWGGLFSQKVKIDAAANLWAGIHDEKTLKPIVLGSHHDAVANGGKYDGAVGVILATEVLQTIYDHQIPMRHPLKIVSFSAEEPNPFNVSTLGSRSVTGVIDQNDLKPIVHSETGERIVDAIKRMGGDVSKLEADRLKPDSLTVFFFLNVILSKEDIYMIPIIHWLWSRQSPAFTVIK